MKIKKEIIILSILIFLTSLNYASAQSVTRGCCTNPGAEESVKCFSGSTLLDLSLCCPLPVEQNPSYYSPPNGPVDYAACIKEPYFYVDKFCISVPACQASGCCCSTSPFGGKIIENFNCKSEGQIFYPDITDAQQCSQKCAVPQCMDGQDNDGNHCADSDDTACLTPNTPIESGGTCKVQPQKCTDSTYKPKISNLQITPATGERKFTLIWQDECPAKSYEISRCKGDKCTIFESIATVTSTSYEDSSDSLLFDISTASPYIYKIVAQYNNGQPSSSLTKISKLGNLECFNQQTANPFCVSPSYYSRYKDYLTSKFANDFNQNNFAAQVISKFSGKFNKAYKCDNNNILIGPSLSCNSQQTCIVSNNQPSCVNKVDCRFSSSNPFGLFFTKENCEKDTSGTQTQDKPCFYDRSQTIVNSCFNCDDSMSCYDYKSDDACTGDHCSIGNGQCIWKNQKEQIGTGVCIKKNDYNCQWCDKTGTAALGNQMAYNKIFDLCTKEKSELLSEPNFPCYFSNNAAKNCNEIACINYSASDCNNNQVVQILHDSNNLITNPSDNKCGIKVCQNIDNKCVKNADGDIDNQPDCDTTKCENDYFPPMTTVTAAQNKQGVYKSLTIVISDKTNAKGSYFNPTSGEYLTFFCDEPLCNENGHPYKNLTKSKELVISDLVVLDHVTGDMTMLLKEGQNTIRYYSQDPAKNLGEVKKITIEAHSNTAGPTVFAVNITESQEISNKIYTNNPSPRIDVEFFVPAVITSAKLTNKATGIVTSPRLPTSIAKINQLPITQTLANGEYLLELNAKNQNNIFMDNVYTKSIVIDTINPKVNVTPINNSLVRDIAMVPTYLTFDEGVKLNSVKINSKDVMDLFTTLDNKNWTAVIPMDDGNKKLEVSAKDYARNPVNVFVNFAIDAVPLTMSLLKPKFGVSSTQTFDVLIATDNNAECRYSLGSAFQFDNMVGFTITGGTNHNIANFNSVPNGGTKTLFVRCKDARGITLKSFNLSVDTSAPQIIKAFAFPNPVADVPPTTTLNVETDEPSICKLTVDSTKSFEQMELSFTGFDDNNFLLINRKTIQVERQGSHAYYAACKNKAEILSNLATISFNVDSSLQLAITSTTSDIFDTTNVVLSLGTNKKAVCTYKSNPSQSSNQFGPEGITHIKELTLNSGKYNYYIECTDASGTSATATINFIVDTTPPVMLFVNDTSTFEENNPLLKFKDKTCLNDILRVKYLGQDPESGVIRYFYSLYKGTQQIFNFVEALVDTGNQWQDINKKPDGTPLSLEDNTRYTFSVKAKNYAGLNSTLQPSDGITVNLSLCQLPPISCGNGLVDTNEQCDPDTNQPVFGSVNKCTSFSNFVGGNLKCRYSTAPFPCTFDTSDCTEAKQCKNGVIEPGEQCEWKQNNEFIFGVAKTCADLGFAANQGQLKCGSNCWLDTSKCTPKPTCGNTIIDPGEECDGTNLGPLNGDCKNYSSSSVLTVFTGGNLKCGGNCRLDTSSCSGITAGTCNDGTINVGEKCDGNLFGTTISNCTSYPGFSGGNINCANCQLDTSGCTPKQKCPNGLIDPGETCDTNNFGILSTSCSQYSAFFSNGALSCNSDCNINTTQCAPANHCGNGIWDDGELCDGNDFGPDRSGTCVNISKTQFTGGNLKCNLPGTINPNTGEIIECQIDNSGCTQPKICGDNKIDLDLNEQCDGSNFGRLSGTCANFSVDTFNGGNLLCNPSSASSKCQINTTQCTPINITGPNCQNGIINPGEDCDKEDLNGVTCMSLGFTSGNLNCSSSCKFDKSRCINTTGSKVCGDGILQEPNDGHIYEQCDYPNLNNTLCTSYPTIYNGGTLNCTGSCIFDYNKCIPINSSAIKCQDGIANQESEDCDGNDLRGRSCGSQGFENGTLSCNGNCRFNTTGCNKGNHTKVCSDGIIQKPNDGNINEECDGLNFDQKTCASFPGYSGTALNCTGFCAFDLSKCQKITDAPICGDGLIGRGEQCDGINFGGNNCQSLGYLNGILSCSPVSCLFNTSQCNLPPHCGNGRIDANYSEQCDPDSGQPVFLEGLNSCRSYSSFIGGNLGCNNCEIDKTDCIRPASCGNGVLEPGEKCEPNSNLFGAAKTCADLGFKSNEGQLKCAPNCLLDTTKCIPKPKCSNGIIDPGEECDGLNIGSLSGRCINYSAQFTGGNLTCNNQCKLDTSACEGSTGTCSNGRIDIGEKCDGNILGTLTSCTNYKDFISGTISCFSNCQLNTTGCIPKSPCGNNLIDPGEECDSNNLGFLNTSCSQYSLYFKGGSISCDSDCKLDTLSCQSAPTCGNGILDNGEICDGSNFYNLTDLRCNSYNSRFVSGTINCSSSCTIRTSLCMTNATVVTCKDRGDCGINETCTDNSQCRSRFCYQTKCTDASCNDRIKNGAESSVDCGGSCSKCAEGITCNKDSDCQSNFCGAGLVCKPQQTCRDGVLSGSETDIDCGGSCPSRCSERRGCSITSDCIENLTCYSSTCKKCAANDNDCNGIPDDQEQPITGETKDTDGDGMPDVWETEHGLNPNDPSDAGQDPDKDGLTNLKEYEVKNSVYAKSTDPNLADTDGDGFTDKQELDAGTNPFDSKDFPKTSKLKIILFILGTLVLVSGFGYLGYTVISRRREGEAGFAGQPREITKVPPLTVQRQPLHSPQDQIKMKEIVKKQEEKKQQDRKKLFETFAHGEKPKTAEAKIESKTAAIKEIKKPALKARKAKRSKIKKSKEDVFAKLREIAAETRQKKHHVKKSK